MAYAVSTPIRVSRGMPERGRSMPAGRAGAGRYAASTLRVQRVAVTDATPSAGTQGRSRGPYPASAAGRRSGTGRRRRCRRWRSRSPGRSRRGCGRQRPAGGAAAARRGAGARRSRRAAPRCRPGSARVRGSPQPSDSARDNPKTSANRPEEATSVPGMSSRGRGGAGRGAAAECHDRRRHGEEDRHVQAPAPGASVRCPRATGRSRRRTGDRAEDAEHLRQARTSRRSRGGHLRRGGRSSAGALRPAARRAS